MRHMCVELRKMVVPYLSPWRQSIVRSRRSRTLKPNTNTSFIARPRVYCRSSGLSIQHPTPFHGEQKASCTATILTRAPQASREIWSTGVQVPLAVHIPCNCAQYTCLTRSPGVRPSFGCPRRRIRRTLRPPRRHPHPP